jgi:S-adenosylmethionine synthetase
MRKDFIITSESVTEGHPDKLCDQISDAIVDRYLRQDPASAIIAECGVATAIVFIAARFATNGILRGEAGDYWCVAPGNRQWPVNGALFGLTYRSVQAGADDVRSA